MSNAAAKVVSLDDYRRERTERMQPAPPKQIVPRNQAAPAVWVYWVPVWVW